MVEQKDPPALKLVPDPEPVHAEYSLRVALKDIYADPKINIRKEFDPAAMTRLSSSLAARGQYESILVTPKCTWWKGGPNGEPWLLIQGSRRYHAALEAKKDSLIVIVKEFASLEDALAANMEENISHEDVSLYDTIGRIRTFCSKHKLMGDPLIIASEETIRQVAREISAKTGAADDYCEELVTLVECVAPEILEKLRYDSTAEQLRRIDLCRSVGDRSLSRREKFEKQLAWWREEGWKSKAGRNPGKPNMAKREDILDMASRIRAAKAIRGPDGGLIDLRQDQADAIASALEWCAGPKGRKAPL